MATAQISKRAPGIRQLLPLPYGAVAYSRRDPLGFLLDGMKRYGDVFRYQVGPLVFHQVAHPDHVRQVLLDNQKNYPRSWFYDRTKPIIGEGLVSTEGPAWRRLRRMAQPAFQRERIAAFGATMTAMTAEMCTRWRAYAEGGEVVDIAAEFIALTLRIVGRTLLSIDLGGAADQIGPAIETLLEYTERRIGALVPLPTSLPTPRERRARAALRTLDGIIYRLIAERRSGSAPPANDLLSLLLSARDEETGGALTDQELRNQILTFVAAGHETTAVALAWTFFLLSQHPNVEERLAAEVASVLGSRAPEVADLPRLAFTRQVIEESLRLYPPVYATVRDAVHDDEIGGYRIPARSMVVLCPYVTHRHPRFWPEPETFDPERFSPAHIEGRPRFAWYPFLGGPHQCIGQEFAMMEATLVVAMVAQSFRLELAPGARVVPKPMLSLRPRDGVPMFVRRV